MLILVEPLAAAEHAEAGHPERPERIDAARAGVADLHLGSDLHLVTPAPAGLEALVRVHSSAHLARLEQTSAAAPGHLDPDTFVTPSSWDAARLAAGAGLTAIEAARALEVPAFVAARPPGHHATGDRAMGFCLLNNVAVAAAALVAAGERVLILDWDVHHGNGTQDIFWDEPDVLYVSLHQWPCYPGTGRADEVGGAGGRGTTLNVPLPPGSDGTIYRAALDVLVAPAVEAFSPTWVLVSAGFDAHRDDPLASMALVADDFAAMATTVASFAPAPGRLLVFLEGGYSLEALRISVAASLGALVGAPRQAPEQPAASPPPSDADEVVARVAAARQEALDRAR